MTLLVSAYGLANLAACSDIVNTTDPIDSSVIAVTITPPSANLNVGDRLTLVATVVAGAGQRNRTVRWTTQNVAVVTVDPNGVVMAVGAGTTNVIVTSAADSSVKAMVPISVGRVGSQLIITSIKHDGADVSLSNVVGQLDVCVALYFGTQTITRVDLLMTCAGVDTVVAVQMLATATASLTLSFNTAAYKNGPCALKVRATTSTGVIVASSAVPITLNNPSTVAPTLVSEDLSDAHTRMSR